MERLRSDMRRSPNSLLCVGGLGGVARNSPVGHVNRRDGLKVCEEEGCLNKHYARKMCRKHYAAWHRAGNAAVCAVENCTKGVDYRGLCSAHMHRLKKYGSTLDHVPSNFDLRTKASKHTAIARFFFALDWRDIRGSDDCWPSSAAGESARYTLIHDASKGGNNQRHKWAYERWVGDVPDGWVVDHLCGNSRCVNPEHLEAVPQQVNMLRGYADAIRRDHGSDVLRRELAFVSACDRSQRNRSGIWEEIDGS